MADESFAKIQSNFLKLADEKTFQKEVSFAVQILNKNSYLAGTSKVSILQAIYNTALTGLTLNPVLKLAYLVPRAGECCLEPSYQGLIKLITDTGSATTVYSYPVYKGDHFKISLGTSIDIEHEPKFESEEIEKFYAVGILHDGTRQVEVMTLAQVNEIRATSESYKSFKKGKGYGCIWESHFSEMGRKTVLRRMVKQLPKTERWDKLGEAIQLDQSDYGITDGQFGMIESLLISAKIPAQESEKIYQELNTMSKDGATECIKHLQENQQTFQDGATDNKALNAELDRKMEDENA